MSASPTRIVFMGTPDFAVPSLQMLIDTPDLHVAGVVTQPDRPAGRGRTIQPPPVKVLAEAANIPVIQPEQRIDRIDALDQLRAWEPDYLVVVAYGQILRQVVLDVPRMIPVNAHASILPRWRGAAPIQRAIKAGDLYTGVTTMQMDAGMDTGPILLQDSIPILPDETGQSLHDKLSVLSAMLLLHTLEWHSQGSIQPHPQPTNAELITVAPMLKKEEGLIDWTQSAVEIDRHVRAFFPWPGTYTFWNGKRLKIINGIPLPNGFDLVPGQVCNLNTTRFAAVGTLAIGTGNGIFVLRQLQLAGRKAQSAADFLNGTPDFEGSTLGASA